MHYLWSVFNSSLASISENGMNFLNMPNLWIDILLYLRPFILFYGMFSQLSSEVKDEYNVVLRVCKYLSKNLKRNGLESATITNRLEIKDKFKIFFTYEMTMNIAQRYGLKWILFSRIFEYHYHSLEMWIFPFFVSVNDITFVTWKGIQLIRQNCFSYFKSNLFSSSWRVFDFFNDNFSFFINKLIIFLNKQFLFLT